LSSGLVPKNIKIETYKNILLLPLLDGCETWSPTLRKECRVKVPVFENTALRRTFGPRGSKEQQAGETA
jgi:hypothetical protein